MVASVLLTCLIAIACCIILALLRGTPLFEALTNGWAADLAQALAVGWPISVAVGIVLAAAMLAVAFTAEKVFWHRPDVREDIYAIRQGLNGEIPRLALWKVTCVMVGVGCVEEAGFRYAATGVIMFIAEPALGFPAAAVIAVAASSAVFAIMHVQYRSPCALGLVGLLGVMLGAVYVATGMLTAVIVAHALYDIGNVSLEARKMLRDPDYFHGEAPVNAVEEEMERALKGE
ncbi:CPBP family glutamic-type intramembrane protease [Adlercreutzia sp. R25]|uniref:CPBP family glutamic-type intramembrane protease n=1 Tax=Adlercreutzia shanghongiae TaxID=3111773 RepID=A0ABU6IYR6_9ACTN|nr:MULTISPECIES: CPBP family glutamic-type intramembrane protease [unclassified Adlercreutzia]MEC4271804.1 CPBP family glutamic-type intramembrane protease [Adlercreutzia sp. R25]MEC4294811.1 CPBP family glutamic-type intramembrane protease [Adlercreutzia sp. R22]